MEFHKVPEHVAIILDGNGRWAEARNLPRTQGHLEGVKRVEEIILSARRFGIRVLTLYTFSTENWNRPEFEVSMLMRTLISVLNQKVRDLNESQIRLQFIGSRKGIPAEVLKSIDYATELTKNNTAMILNIAFNYGGRVEILEAVSKIASDVQNQKIRIEEIDEALFSQYLYTRGLPDPDLLIRTSGEKRISNFLLWQLSYAEFYFTEKFWPEFNEHEFLKAIEDYQLRERRYGSIGSKKN